MGFEGYDQWKTAGAFKHERDEAAERDEAPLFRIMFQYVGSDADGFVRARWERLDSASNYPRWRLFCSGRGSNEATSIKALRDNLRALRRRQVRHIPMGDWSTEYEVVL